MSEKKRKPSGELRQSQVLTTFGPGSMVDLPTRSVVISGLTYWKGECQLVREDRLRYKVAKSLSSNSKQSNEQKILDIQLRTPP